MAHILTSGSNDGLAFEVIEAMDRLCADIPDDLRDKVTLLVAARLCERTAFSNAREWEPAAVANLLLLSAQIERFMISDRELD